jgi:hypothetical protein
VNIFFAHYWLKEELQRTDVWGTLMIISGSVIAVAFGDHDDKTYTLQQLGALYKQTSFIIYAVGCSSLILILYLLAKWVEPIKLRLTDAIFNYDEAVHWDKSAKEIEELDRAIAEVEIEYKPWAKIYPFSYCALAGLCGGNNILFGKMVAELIAETLGGNNQLFDIMTYVYVAAMVATIFTQLHFLARALNSFDALYVVPVFQCFWVGSSVVGGAAYFQDFKEFTYIQFICFPVGIAMELLGVIVMSQRNMGTDRSKSPLTTTKYTSVDSQADTGRLLGSDDAEDDENLTFAVVNVDTISKDDAGAKISSLREAIGDVLSDDDEKTPARERKSISKYAEGRSSHRSRHSSVASIGSDDEDRSRAGSFLDWNPASGVLTPHFDVAVAEMEINKLRTGVLLHAPPSSSDNTSGGGQARRSDADNRDMKKAPLLAHEHTAH